MIRNDELPVFLDTVLRTVAFDLRPDLCSGGAKKSADYLIEVLSRLLAQARDGERIALEHLDAWKQLRVHLPGTEAPAAESGTGSLRSNQEQLDAETGCIQHVFAAADAWSGATRTGIDSSEWFARAVAASLAYWQAVEDSVQPIVPAAAATKFELDPELLRAKLSAYLEVRFPGLPKDPVRELRIASGGNTKRTAILSMTPNELLPKGLVLRQDLPVNLTGARVVDEFPLLERLHRLGILIPQPVLIEPNSDVLGSAFMLVAEVEDAVPAGTYFAKDRALYPTNIGREFGRDAAVELAKLHRLTAVENNDADGRWRAHRASLETAHRRWKGLDKPANSVIIDLGYAWLNEQTIDVDRPLCLIHGDYSCHNMMARNGRLAAVLDWELAQLGEPAIDLAEARMMLLEDTLPWVEFVAAYLEAGGDPRACDPQVVDYYLVWSYIEKYGMMMADARVAYLAGARTDGLMASVASSSMDRMLLYAARSLSIALRQPPPGERPAWYQKSSGT